MNVKSSKHILILLLVIAICTFSACAKNSSSSKSKTNSLEDTTESIASTTSTESTKDNNTTDKSSKADTTSTTTSLESSADPSQIKLLPTIQATNTTTSYHLIYDILKNTSSTATQDKGVTYLFSENTDGSRSTDALVATYSDVSSLDTSSLSTMVNGFIKAHFSELNDYTSALVSQKINTNDTLSLTFEDVQFSFFTNSDKNSMSVIISTYE